MSNTLTSPSDQKTKRHYGCESQTVEFKSSFTESAGNHADDQAFVIFKAACAMMNADGGKIYIGISDETGYPVRGKYSGVKGDMMRLHLKNNDAYARHINKIMCQYFVDSQYVRGLVYAQETEDEDVIEIVVKPADRVVFIRNRQGEKMAFRREGASSRLMSSSMISQRKKELSAQRKAERPHRMIIDNIQIIREAIKSKKKIKIHNYLSSNSNHKSNRVVEPISFICDDRSIMAYEEANADNSPMRQFKISRMGYVECLEESWEHEEKHTEVYIDAFEWTRATKPDIHICILVGPKAYNYLMENNPGVRDFLTEASSESWLLDTDVHSLEPVKSFCKACSDIIEVYCPDELRVALGLKPLELEAQAQSIVELSEDEKDKQPNPGIAQHFKGIITKLTKILKKTTNYGIA